MRDRSKGLVSRGLLVSAVATALIPLHTETALASPSLDAYQGLGTWVDIYDPRDNDPADVIHRMKLRGVRTLYLETSNYKREVDIKWRARVDRYIDAAHREGLKVVAWYLPGFRSLRRDYRRSMKAIRFRTDQGNRFDSFALDIESPLVESPTRRTTRLLRLSRRINRSVGPNYPLGAIIPSPRGMEKNPDYWPGFPYKRLAGIYDVFLPMTYYTWRVKTARGSHDYTAKNIHIVRRETGIRNVPIHVIGGIANESSGRHTRSFVRAVRENGIIGASFYTFFITDFADWRQLRHVPKNPVQKPALPVGVGFAGALGANPLDWTHPKEVFYRATPISGGRQLSFRVFDVQPDEVELWINWRFVKKIAPTNALEWSDTRQVWIPSSLLRNDRRNFISYTVPGPFWHEWGVRSVSLATP